MKRLSICNFEHLQNHLINIETIPKVVEIDLTNYESFIRPIFIVTIAQFIRFLRLRGHIVENLILPQKTNINKYLQHNINFLNLFHANFETLSSNSTSSLSLGSLPLMYITKDTIPDKKTIITQFLKSKCEDRDFTTIEVCLDEILNNCFDHANSKTGVIGCGQYIPTSRQIRLAICDTGIGIPNCVNTYLDKNNQKRKSSQDAISWAFEQHNTTQSTPTNRGRGLHTLHTAIESCKGNYRVITHDKWLIKAPGRKVYRDTANFFGTAIEFEINIDHLPELEFGDFDYDF